MHAARLHRPAVLLAIVVVGLGAPVTPAVSHPGRVSGQTVRRAALSPVRSLLGVINAVRAEHGLAPVRPQGQLRRAAEAHSADMLARDYFLHESGAGGEPFNVRLARFLHRAASTRVGEILYWGSGDLASPRAAVEGWLNSPPHRAILLSPTFSRVGIGRSVGAFQGARDAAVWTADFSSR